MGLLTGLVWSILTNKDSINAAKDVYNSAKDAYHNVKDLISGNDDKNTDTNSDSYNITNSTPNVTVEGTDAAETILNYAEGKNVVINGGDGNDSITSLSDYVTIFGGGGNDYISLPAASTDIVIKYNQGDGNDSVYGFNSNDTLKIFDSDYNTTQSNNDWIVNVGSGSVLLKDAANISVNVIEAFNSSDTINTGSSAVQSVSIDASGNVVVALDDKSIDIEDGEGKTIKFKNDFISGGPLNIQFSEELKINEEAKFYWGVGENVEVSLANFTDSAINVSLNNSNFNDTTNPAFYGDIKTIDARGYNGYALLSGKDNVDNVIYGNETSCAMWGGNGGNDTLIGGNGSDLFWYVNGGGTDIIQNANSNDTVRFDGITLDELVGGSGQIIGNDVKVELKNGGSLTVENARNSEVVFDFNDTKYAVNSSTGEWEFR